MPAPEPEPEPEPEPQPERRPQPQPQPQSQRQTPLLTSWTHAGGCTDPACADPACRVAATPASPTSAVPTDTAAQPAVCRHWWRKGSCLYGDSCKFGHPPHETLPPWPRRAYRQQTYNAGRVGIFRRWIVETFGLELLRRGGVLDVRAINYACLPVPRRSVCLPVQRCRAH